MTRKNLIFVVVAFIVGVSVWLFQINRDFNETRDLLIGQAEQINVNQPRPRSTLAATAQTTVQPSAGGTATTGTSAAAAPTASATPAAPADVERLTAELQGLQNQLEIEKTAFTNQQTRYEQLRAAQANQQQRDPSAYTNRIENSNTQIESFIDQLNGYQSAEQEINRRANDALREQSSQAQFAREQLDENIRLQELQIRRTQEELMIWQNGGANYINERDARIQELRVRLETEIQQAEQMRQQKVLISSNVVVGAQTVQAEKTQALNQISESRSDVREEIARLREYVNSLETAQGQTRSSQFSLNSQIVQGEKDLQTLADRVRMLEAAVAQKNQQISNVR